MWGASFRVLLAGVNKSLQGEKLVGFIHGEELRVVYFRDTKIPVDSLRGSLVFLDHTISDKHRVVVEFVNGRVLCLPVSVVIPEGSGVEFKSVQEYFIEPIESLNDIRSFLSL